MAKNGVSISTARAMPGPRREQAFLPGQHVAFPHGPQVPVVGGGGQGAWAGFMGALLNDIYLGAKRSNFFVLAGYAFGQAYHVFSPGGLKMAEAVESLPAAMYP